MIGNVHAVKSVLSWRLTRHAPKTRSVPRTGSLELYKARQTQHVPLDAGRAAVSQGNCLWKVGKIDMVASKGAQASWY